MTTNTEIDNTDTVDASKSFNLQQPEADKFGGSYEELKKAYAELEKKLGSRFTGEQPKKASTSEQEQPKEETPKVEVNQKSEPKPTNVKEHDEAHLEHLKAQYGEAFAEYFEHYMTNGTLTDKHFAELEKKGFSRNVVEHLIDVENRATAATLAQQQAEETELKNIVGGNDSYNNMVAWAQKNLNAGEVEAFDSLMETGTRAQKQLAIEALGARFSKAQPADTHPKKVVGGNKPVGVRPYRSQSELIADIRDPRYHRDTAFRSDVERRLSVSKL